MSGYKGNPVLFNGRVERQQAREAAEAAETAAREAAAVRLLEAEREAAGIVVPKPRRLRSAPEPAGEEIVATEAEAIQAEEAAVPEEQE